MILDAILLMFMVMFPPMISTGTPDTLPEYGGGPSPAGDSVPFTSLLEATPATRPAGLTSTMIRVKDVQADYESAGMRLVPIPELGGKTLPGLLSPTQAFEIVRPGMHEITLGRLGTSCSCIELVSPKRTFAKGERAIIELRNVRPTPPGGYTYSIFAKVTSPGATVLKLDTFVRSDERFENRHVHLPSGQKPVGYAPALFMKEISIEDDYNHSTETSSTLTVHMKLSDEKEIATEKYYDSFPRIHMQSNHLLTNKTILLKVEGKGSGLYRLDDATDKISLQCECEDNGACPCFYGDNTIVRKNKLYSVNAATKRFKEICDCSDPACGCEELNVVVDIDKDDGKRKIYIFRNNARKSLDPVMNCDEMDNSFICNNPDAYTDAVYDNGIRYSRSDENLMIPQCFCSTLGCECPGYNPPAVPKVATRPLQANDRVVIDDRPFLVCKCHEPGCICIDKDRVARHDEIMAAARNSNMYYDDRGQPYTGGGGFKAFGTILGIAQAVIPMVGGGGGTGAGMFSKPSF